MKELGITAEHFHRGSCISPTGCAAVIQGYRASRELIPKLVDYGSRQGVVKAAERAYDRSLIGRLNRWRMRSVCERGKNSYEFDCDQRQEHASKGRNDPATKICVSRHFSSKQAHFNSLISGLFERKTPLFS
jgi:hypothetical protein